ncbi:MAG: flagellar basal body-associated FliL family protein [Candidatus Sedimenticola endophacoides]
MPNAMAADEDGDAPPPKTAYHSLSPSLISNLQGQRKYVRCDIQLMTKGEDKLELIKQHDPAIRHELLMLLGDQAAADLKTPKGKEALRKQALEAVNRVLAELTEEQKLVKDLFFTSFFVQ